LFKKRTLIILLIFLGIAALFGLYLAGSWNLFFSLLLIGFWILFTIKFFQKRKEYQEYNSPKNTSFFLLCPLGVGLFYNFWGYFTGLLGENLLEDFSPFLYISPWTLLFALPYIMYGLLILRACYKKFDIVYIIRTRSINARKFAIIYTVLILIALLSYIIYFNVILNYFYIVVEQTYFYFDVMLLFFAIFLGYLFVRHAILGSKRIIPEVSQDYLTRRRRRIESVASTPIRSTRRTTPSASSSRRPSPRASTPQPSRATSRPTTSRPTTRRSTTQKPKTTSTQRTVTRKPKVAASQLFEKLKPKAGILSLEDFKCIFCFELPKFPSEEKRGIVLCPNCKHPAHADEFKGWTTSSPLCSRCDASIPPSFRRNPRIILVKDYVRVINEFKKRKG